MNTTPQRIAAKFFVEPDPRAPVELHPFIGLFHRFIQEKAVEGLLLDVADYAHVQDGPGIVLIGHDVDYGLDLAEGRAGLLTTCKRCGARPLAEILVDTLRKALGAVQAVEGDEAIGLRFATNALKLQFLDRLATPNTDEAFSSVRGAVEPVAEALFGDGGFELSRAHADDPRKVLALEITAPADTKASVLVGRLGRV